MSLLGSNLYCVPYGDPPQRKTRTPPRKSVLRDGTRRLIHRRGAMRLSEVAHHINCSPAEVWELLVDDDTLGVQWYQGNPGGNGARRSAVPFICLIENET